MLLTSVGVRTRDWLRVRTSVSMLTVRRSDLIIFAKDVKTNKTKLLTNMLPYFGDKSPFLEEIIIIN